MNETDTWATDSAKLTRKSAAQQVFEELRDKIASGKVEAGVRLPSELQLAQRYAVSRPIIREALRSLQTLGLVQTRTGAGTFVCEPGAPDLHFADYSATDLAEARPLIEIPAAGWAAARRSEAQLAGLLKLCDRLEAEEDHTAWVSLDTELHGAIAAASGNAICRRVVADMREALRGQSGLLNILGPRQMASNVEHRAIVTAIGDRDSGAARAAMAAHLEQVAAFVTRIADGRPA